jgi:beta-glucosidase
LKNARYETGYLDESIEPLFPFGFGLSYSPFEVSDIKLDASSVRLPNGMISGSVRLTNRGERAGKEVVQIYMRQRVGSRSRPSRQFVAFEKVMLAPGEAREVRFSVPARALTFHDDDGKALLEAGDYDVFVGTDARASLTTSVRFLAAR